MKEKKIRSNYKKLTEELIKRNLTISTMESATSGQIASLITDTEGASAILKGAYVTYSNEAKIKQGVSAECIEKYGVYSPETAKEMAETCRYSYKADIGIGVTGSFGNVDPANNDSIPGSVDYAISIGHEIIQKHLTLPLGKKRYEYKLLVAKDVVKTLLKKLKEGV